MLDRGSELDAFKREICLVEYALGKGYAVDRRASSRSSVVLTDPGGDKVVVARAPDGHWVFFSVRDDQDNGTIIDFVQRRTGLSLGEIRRELRPWLGRPPSPALPQHPPFWLELTPVSKDRLLVQARLEGMAVATSHQYLERERAIPRDVLAHARFVGQVRSDSNRNAVFPHWEDGAVCGFELKNRGFTGFAANGEKALWLSHAFEADDTLVVTESAIDALSHFAIHRPASARYASIAGSMNRAQPKLLAHEASQLRPNSAVIIATDNDAGGDRLAACIREALLPCPIRVVEDRPVVRDQDWNDVLRGSRPEGFPAVPKT